MDYKKKVINMFIALSLKFQLCTFNTIQADGWTDIIKTMWKSKQAQELQHQIALKI